MNEKDKEIIEGIKGVWIPGEIAFNKKLTKADMFVWWQIDVLDISNKHCFAGNGYLAKRLGLAEKTISKSISKLKKLEYIKETHFDGRLRVLTKNNTYLEKYKHLVDAYNKGRLLQMGEADSSKNRRQTPTNGALDINNNIQTITKKEITNVISPTKLEDIEEIFKYYLKVANKMKKYLSENNIKSDKLTIHQNIYSKCTVSLPDNKDDAVSIPIIDIISEYLDSYSVDEFKTAIDNYYTVFISNLTEDKYWYKVIWKNIGSFIYSGVHRDTGFKSFLDLKKLIRGYNVNLPEIDQLRSEFKPITKEYKLNNIFDKEINTYYGFETDRFIDSSLMNEYESDVKHGYNNNKFSYGYFCYLEELIASIFWNRKAGYDLELLKALMSIWKEKKPEFKKTVLELR